MRLGNELLRLAFEATGRELSPKALSTAAKLLNVANAAELRAHVGAAEISARRVVSVLYPETAMAEPEVDATRPVAGLEADQSFLRAPCCQPLPGERIIGITYRGKGVVAHCMDCEALADFEEQPERWIDLRWLDGTHAAIYGVTLDLTISNDAGVLGRVCSLIGEHKANISDLRFVDRKPDFYRLLIEVELRGITHLHQVMTALEAESAVAQVVRSQDPALRP